MKVKSIYIYLCILLMFSGCTQKTSSVKDSSANLTAPKQVVENYFKYKNEKNKEGMLTTLTEGHDQPNVVWGFEGLEYVKIISINEETDPMFREGYLFYGRGSIKGVKGENLKVYRVEYEIKYRLGANVSEKSGKNVSWFDVIRKDKDSPWLIDSMGQP